jgi:hypothetical protein
MRDQLIQHHIWQVLAQANCWLTSDEIIQDSQRLAQQQREQIGWRVATLPVMSAARRFAAYPPELLPSEITHNLYEMASTHEYVMAASVTVENLSNIWNERFAVLPHDLRAMNQFKEVAKFWNGKIYPEQLPDSFQVDYARWQQASQPDHTFPLERLIAQDLEFNLREQRRGEQLREVFSETLKSDPASPVLVVYYASLPLPDAAEGNPEILLSVKTALQREGYFPARALPSGGALEAEVIRAYGLS